MRNGRGAVGGEVSAAAGSAPAPPPAERVHRWPDPPDLPPFGPLARGAGKSSVVRGPYPGGPSSRGRSGAKPRTGAPRRFDLDIVYHCLGDEGDISEGHVHNPPPEAGLSEAIEQRSDESIRDQGGEPGSRQVGELLDERLNNSAD